MAPGAWGGKGKGKGKGGKKNSSSGNWVQGELVSKVKDFQRSSEENKQIWWSFADSQGSGRDPARYEEGLLQAFLAEHGIEGVQGTTEQNFAKGEVIIKIKAFQRSSEEGKQAWWAFCDAQEGQNRDPARYEVDVLQAFLAEHGIQFVQQGTEQQKASLVAKIKGFQKSGEDQKQAWWAYCENQASKKRDPVLHEVAVLQAFVNANGL